MSSEDKLPPEVEASYSAIIDGILAASDLTTITAKAIRKGLQQQVEYDISPQKKPITDLIMTRFDKYQAEQDPTSISAPDGDVKPSSSTSPPEPALTSQPKAKPSSNPTNGAAHSNGKASKKRSASPDEDNDDGDDISQLSSLATPPPKKKHKKSRSVELSDAALAARLQAEENGRIGRATRGAASGGRRKTPLKKAKAERRKTKKSKARVGSDDDSSAENGGEKKEVKRTGGFHKPMALSAPLTSLLGETQLSRPQTVKKIWEYIKANDLQDPSDKRQIICDDAMRSVFKSDKVHMFTMNKILNQNLYAVDEVIGGGE